MLEGLISVLGGFNTAHETYKRISGMIRGDTDKSAQYLETMCEHLGGIRGEFERLSDTILYAPNMNAVHDTTQSQQQKVEDLRNVREYLDPVQKALDEDILSSAIVLTPDKMQQALNKSPWEVLMDVRPVSLASKPDNPDLLPILFAHSGMHYIGWQMRGTLPILFNCEFDELWLPDDKIDLSQVVDVRDTIPQTDFEFVDDSVPISDNEAVAPIVETPDSYPEKPDFKNLFNPERDPFEYPQEFAARYQVYINQFNLAVVQHQETYQAGVAVLQVSNYDIHSGHFPFEIKLADWTRKLPTIALKQHLQAARNDAKKLWEEGAEKPIFYVLQNVEAVKEPSNNVF